MTSARKDDRGTAVPFTTIPTAALSVKIPAGVGDSWRPALAGLFGAVPLAVAAGVTGVALMGGASVTASAVASPHAGAPAAQACVTTVTSGALGQLKYPECYGD
jgi:hypothetical protein